MSAGPVRIDKLVELAIAGKELPLALLLEVLAPLKELRRLAREFGRASCRERVSIRV